MPNPNGAKVGGDLRVSSRTTVGSSRGADRPSPALLPRALRAHVRILVMPVLGMPPTSAP
eukprot:1896496-Amphidinium_carterae.1